MLKYYLCLYLLLYLIQTYAQNTVIFKQGFENQDDNWPIDAFSTPPCTNDEDTWNFHNELNEIKPSEGFSFWGISDLNGNCGSSGFEYIDFKTVDISTLRNVILSFDVQIIGYDNGDDMKYQLWLDHVGQDEIIFVEGENDLTTNGWKKIEIPIPNYVNDLKLRIKVKQNGSDSAGLDNFHISGEKIDTCQELMISEYIEGSSSSNHRNNYIELYNPTNDTIDLSPYKLLKFTGNNTSYSQLQLMGNMVPFGTFLIKDAKEIFNVNADLSTNSAVMDFNGDDKIAIQIGEKIIDLIGVIGEADIFANDRCLRRKSYIKSPNNEYNTDEWDEYAMDNIKDLNQHSSICEKDLPEIEVLGNNDHIIDGNTKTSLLNNTYFGAWPIAMDTIIQLPFVIKNTGSDILKIDEIVISGTHAENFSHSFLEVTTIMPNDSIILQISYSPNTQGLHNGQVNISNNDPSESNYSFVIQGEGTGIVSHPLIISQYYEGLSNNRWIEITNTSNETIPPNNYFLALYRNNNTYEPIGRRPYRNTPIPELEGGQVLKFSATLNVTMPEYALDGTEIKTAVCGFTGDDIILISTSNDESCWENRTDIIGQTGNWGQDISMVRKNGCDAVSANTGYAPKDWVLHSIDDINDAISGANMHLGSHRSGVTTWFEGTWSDGDPDEHKKAIIADYYNTGNHGNLTTCSLHILGESSFIIEENSHVRIHKDLIVDGILEVNNNGALIMHDDTGQLVNNGSIKIHKKSAELNPLDYTYWSSPVKHADLETVFKGSPKNSFFNFATLKFNDTNKDGIDDDNNAWVAVSGIMEIGRGYTSMAPNGDPFSTYQYVTFEGDLNNGEIHIPIKKHLIADEPSWNLIGNPYPSSINAESIFEHPLNKDMLYGTLYFWTHATEANTESSNGTSHYAASDYAMYTKGVGGVKAHADGITPTRYISSCQGFFVRAQNSGSLIINNAMRDTEEDAIFFKATEDKKENKIWINLTSSEGEFSQILIGFVKHATIGFDNMYDGLRIGSNKKLSFYSLTEDHRLGIQGLPEFKGNEVIPLAIYNNHKSPSSMEISLDRMTGNISNYNVYIYDKLLHKSHNLKDTPYPFISSQKGFVDERFEIRFSDKINSTEESKYTKINWNYQDHSLLVYTNKLDTIRQIKIFDLNGRTLKDLKTSNPKVEFKWAGFPKRAIYILKVLLSDSRILTSKILP